MAIFCKLFIYLYLILLKLGVFRKSKRYLTFDFLLFFKTSWSSYINLSNAFPTKYCSKHSRKFSLKRRRRKYIHKNQPFATLKTWIEMWIKLHCKHVFLLYSRINVCYRYVLYIISLSPGFLLSFPMELMQLAKLLIFSP